jgi:hypothetical protein
MVNALARIADFHGTFDAVWYGRRMILEVAALDGAVANRYIELEARRHGIFCGEWVPFMALAAMRLYSKEGQVVNPTTHYRALCDEGTLLKDVAHWSWTQGGNLQVNALTRTLTYGIRRQLGDLMHLLVLNYPQLLVPGTHDQGVRYSTADPGHVAILRMLTVDRRLCAPGMARTRQLWTDNFTLMQN